MQAYTPSTQLLTLVHADHVPRVGQVLGLVLQRAGQGVDLTPQLRALRLPKDGNAIMKNKDNENKICFVLCGYGKKGRHTGRVWRRPVQGHLTGLRMAGTVIGVGLDLATHLVTLWARRAAHTWHV